MIAITGDLHGDIDYRTLNNSNVKKACGGTFPQYVIVAGDFGVPWSNSESNSQDIYLKKWYGKKPYDLVIIPGNHENYDRIEKMPQDIYHGALVYRYSNNIVFVQKNQILTLEDKTFYCFGGADSIDKEYRKPFISWWPQEKATYADFLIMQTRLKITKAVDYVISHAGPSSIVKEMFDFSFSTQDSTEHILEYLKGSIAFKHWYFGHYHENKTIKNFSCLYKRIIPLDK